MFKFFVPVVFRIPYTKTMQANEWFQDTYKQERDAVHENSISLFIHQMFFSGKHLNCMPFCLSELLPFNTKTSQDYGKNISKILAQHFFSLFFYTFEVLINAFQCLFDICIRFDRCYIETSVDH